MNKNMNKNMKTARKLGLIIIMASFLGGIVPIPQTWAAETTTVKTRIGELLFTHDFKNGYPTDETVKKLYDEIDFQRACHGGWGRP